MRLSAGRTRFARTALGRQQGEQGATPCIRHQICAILEGVSFVENLRSRCGIQTAASGKRAALRIRTAKKHKRCEAGVTLIELFIASSLLVILASAALPIVRTTIVRSKEVDRKSTRLNSS